MDPSTPRLDALVLGAGVIGLTTAVRLLERGHRVTVRAAARTPGTTSDAAAALFFPYAHGAGARTAVWLATSYMTFRRLARDPATGVSPCPVVEVDASSTPAWLLGLPEARPKPCDDDADATASGHRAWMSLVIEMPRYLRWLEARVLDMGGRIETVRVQSLQQLLGERDVVVNCSGIGARDLVHDERLRPLRGQTVRVADPGLSHATLDMADPTRPPTYLVPRKDGVIIGGTLEPDREDLAPDPEAERAMLTRAARLDPRIESAEVLDRRVGLRPGRDAVRLEAETLEGLRIVHHYGHGGAGVTLSWGSADDAAELVEQHARPSRPPHPAPRLRRTPARIYTKPAHRRPAR